MARPASEGHPSGGTMLESLEARLHAAAQATRQHGNRHLHQTAMRMRNFPDWGRRSIRLSLCMLILGVVGHTNHSQLAAEIKQAANWAAITCIVVSAPLMGQVAEVSVYRVVGTMLGGILGYAVYTLGTFVFDADEPGGLGDYRAGLMVVFFAPLVVTPTTYLAYKHSADQLTKFVQLTYVVVGFAASMKGKSATLLAVLRVSGIIMGALLSLLLAVIVLPRSATIESCRELKKSIKALADLNQAVWGASQHPVPSELKQKKRTGVMARLAGLTAIGNLFSSAAVGRPGRSTSAPNAKSSNSAVALQSLLNSAGDTKMEGEAEKLFTAVYAGLSRVESMLEQCKGEVFVHHLYGHYLFLPLFWPSQLYGFKFKHKPRGRWQLPVEDMTVVITVLRRIARLLWTLLLDFEDGFNETMVAVLAQYYPKALMSELVLYTHKSLMDLYTAFPNGQLIEIDNLLNLGQVVECLIHISDTRNRGAFHPRRKRNAHRQRYGSTGLSGSPPMPGPSGPLPDSLEDTQGWASPNAPPSTLTLDSAAKLVQSAAQTAVGHTSVRVNAGPISPLMFASHTLSGKLGEVSLLELPPRRLMRAAAASGSLDLVRTQSGNSSVNDPLHNSMGYSSMGKKTANMEFSKVSQQAARRSSAERHAGHDADSRSEQQVGAWPGAISMQQRQLLPMLPTIPSQSELGSTALPHLRSDASLSPFASAQNLVQLGTQAYDKSGMQAGSQQCKAAQDAGDSSISNHIKRCTSYKESDRLLGDSVLSTVAGDGTNAATQVLDKQQQHQMLPYQGCFSHNTYSTSSTALQNDQQEREDVPLLRAPTNLSSDSEQQGTAGATQQCHSEWPSGGVQVPFHRFSSGISSSSMHDRASPATPRASGSGDEPRHVNINVTRCSFSSEQQAVTAVYDHTPLTAGLHGGAQRTPEQQPQGVAPTALAARLESLLASAAVEPITFPPTEEGYVSQVRWHSMQWLLDELVEELEEAFLGLSIIMAKLPHPIK